MNATVTRLIPKVEPPTTEPALQDWSLLLPFDKPRTTNVREHWSVRRREVELWRSTTAWLCKQARIPRCERIRVGMVYAAPDNRRRDASNLDLKACIDGIVDARVVPDDTAGFVSVRESRILPGGAAFGGGARVVLTIERLA